MLVLFKSVPLRRCFILSQNFRLAQVSETDGPGLLYGTRIRQARWKELDREGATAWYEKDGKVIALTTFDGELYIENSSKEEIGI